MITNAQHKKDINSILKLFRILYEGNRLDAEELHEIQTRINAIPEEEPEEPHIPLGTEDLNFIIDHLKKQPENKTGKFNYFQHSNRLVGPGPRTEQQNRKLEKELNKQHEGVMSGITNEIERYKLYVEYMNGLGNKAIMFGEWVTKDRQYTPKGDPDIEADGPSPRTRFDPDIEHD